MLIAARSTWGFLFWEKCSYEAQLKPEPKNIPLMALCFLQMSYSSSINSHYFEVKTHTVLDMKLIWMIWNRKVILNYHCSQICWIFKTESVHFCKRTMKVLNNLEAFYADSQNIASEYWITLESLGSFFIVLCKFLRYKLDNFQFQENTWKSFLGCW